MALADAYPSTQISGVTPSRRTLQAELLRLCARIGYSPPASR
ncbi:MAG: capsid protein [Pseudaminobacter sp.]|nr:capsid protein [Pseudaminobacter sp.]